MESNKQSTKQTKDQANKQSTDQATSSNGLLADYLGFIGRLKLPRIDTRAVLESRRKDIEALVAANTTALAGMQSLGRKQMEIVNARMTRLQSLVERRTDSQAGAEATGVTLQNAFSHTLSDVRELVETVCRAQADSVAVISKRVAENVEEWKTLLQPGK